MTDLITGMPPAGWYPDRPQATTLRWWDGSAWTDNWHEMEPAINAPAPDPATRRGAGPAAIAQLSSASIAVLERTDPSPRGVAASFATTAAVAAASASSAAIPAVDVIAREPMRPRRVETPAAPVRRAPAASSHAVDVEARRTSVQTFPGWLLALSPLWVGAGAFAAVALFASYLPLISQALLGVLAFVLLIVLARVDSARLRERDVSAPSMWWAIVPLLYFIRRVATAGRASIGLLVTYLLAAVAVAGAVFFLTTQTALLPTFDPQVAASTDGTVVAQVGATLTAAERSEQLTETGAEAKLRSDLEQTWGVGAVDCQPFPSQAAQATTTCVVELDGVTYNAGLQITPDEPTVAFVLTGMLPVEP